MNAGRNVQRAQPLHPIVRRSPYFGATEAAGAVEYMVYNHMYMPMDYGRSPETDYVALTERVTLWDVGAERQTEIRGPDAVRFADYLCARDLRDLGIGRCRYAPVCDASGLLMAECIVLRPYEDVLWISHGDVDLTVWAQGVALRGEFDVIIDEPDVAPLQLQGPRSVPLIASLAGDAIAQLPYYACAPARIAGVDLIVSRTGWSRETGFEIYPLSSGRALALWDAVVTAGAEHELLVTGPNLIRACEQGITDNCYAVNDGMTPFEAGAGWAVDLGARPFVGREALLESAASPAARRTVGLAGPESNRFPRLESFWPIVAGGSEVGRVRWAVNSIALGRPIAIGLVDASVEIGSTVTVVHPDGDMPGDVVELPFVH
jgi:glycine cleavage system aminomethyltransferase T